MVGVEHGGVDFTGIDGGAANTVFAFFEVDGVAQPGYAVFAGDVGDAGVGAAPQAGAGDDVDDLAAAVGSQVGEDFSDDVVGAVEVDVDDLSPGFEWDVVEIAQGGVDTGVVNDEIDAAELGDGAGHELLDVGVVGDVAGTGEDLDAGGAGLSRGGGERVRRAGSEGEIDPFGGESAQDAEADAGAGASEDGVLAAEFDGRASDLVDFESGQLSSRR